MDKNFPNNYNLKNDSSAENDSNNENNVEALENMPDFNEFRSQQEEEHLEEHKVDHEQIAIEKTEESRKFLSQVGWNEYTIDSLLYEKDYELNEDGSYKRSENGHLIQFIDKTKIKQPIEYLFKNGISIKDLGDSGIIDARTDWMDDIEDFTEDFYYLTDEEYFPSFNKRHRPLQSLTNIIEKRKKHEPLAEEDRDFTYDCRFEGIRNGVDFGILAGRLLFGGNPNNADTNKRMLEEVSHLSTDETNKFIQRVYFVERCNRRMKDIVPFKRNYEEAGYQIKESIRKNTPAIFERVDDLFKYKEYLSREEMDDSLEAEEVNQELKDLGYLLLRNCEYGAGGMGPGWWNEKNDYNQSGLGMGDTMLKCGISSDEILDTYFGGPKQLKDANYKSTYPHLEPRKVGNLMKIGIPKDDIIDHIRKKNIEDPFSVPVNDKAIQRMRKDGIENPDILDAMQPYEVSYFEHRPNLKEELNSKGFTDEDILKYMSRELLRAEKEREEKAGI